MAALLDGDVLLTTSESPREQATVTGGGGWQPGLLRLTPRMVTCGLSCELTPPPHIRNRLLGKKMKFIKGAPKLEVDFGYTTFFFCL